METKSWVNLTLLITLLATVLHLAGFFEPLWIYLDADDYHVAVGLWYSEGCGIDNSCNPPVPTLTFGVSPDDTYHDSDFKAVQALETLGTIGAVMLLIFVALYRYGYSKWRHLRKIYLAALWISIFAWFFVLLGVIVFCATFWRVVGTSNLVSDRSFPWAMLQCFFASVLFVIVTVLLWLKCWSSDFVKTSLPVSGDSHMDLYPVSHRDTFRRFFHPAYHQSRRPNNAIVFGNQEDINPPGLYEGRMIDEGFERNRLPAIDNMAFNDRYALERGLPYQQPVRTQTIVLTKPEPPPPEHHHTVVRETIPARTVVYEYDSDSRGGGPGPHSARPQTVVMTKPEPPPPEYHHTVVRETIPARTVVYEYDSDSREGPGHVVERRVTREQSARPHTVVVSEPEPPPPEHHHKMVRETIPAHTVVYEYDSDSREGPGHVLERRATRERSARPEPPPPEHNHTLVRETIPARTVVYEYDSDSRVPPYEETQPIPRAVRRTFVPDGSNDNYYGDMRPVNRFRPVDPDPSAYRDSPILVDRDDLRGTTARETRYYNDEVYPSRNGVTMEQYVTRPIYSASKPYVTRPNPTTRVIYAENAADGRRTPTADYMPTETYFTSGAPIITSSRPYSDPPRHFLLADRGTDSRYTHDGRLMANADYLVDEPTYGRHDAVPGLETNYNGGSGALRYTTHANPFSNPTTFLGARSGALGNSTYIYRPHTLQHY